MAATRTEQDQTVRKVYLSVMEIQDVICALNTRAWRHGIENATRQNCWRAADWLKSPIADKSLIQEIEIQHRTHVLKGISASVIAAGLEGVGTDILNQIAEAGD